MTDNSTEITRRDPGSDATLMQRIAAIGVPDKLAEGYLALNPDSDVLEVLIQNLGGEFEDIDLTKLPRLKFPTGGETMFNVPDSSNANGVRQEKRITAIMVVSQPRRAFWPTVNLTGNPPSCFALDGRNGQGDHGKGSKSNPTGKCAKCPMAEYGSKARLDGAQADAGGQACKQTRLLHLLMPGAALPLQLSVPPASLKVIDEYLMNLAAVGTPTPFYAVEVELSLNRVGAENPYAELSIATNRVLDADEVAITKVYAKALKAQLDEAGESVLLAETRAADGEEGPHDSGVAGFGEAAQDVTATGGFDDVGTTDEEDYGQGAASGAGRARSGAKA